MSAELIPETTCMRAKATKTTTLVLGSVAALGVAAAVAGLGTFGAFADSTAPAQPSVSTGILSLDLAQRTSVSTLPISSLNMVPGTSVQRTYDLKNSGTLDSGPIVLTGTASKSNLLSTDAANGVQVTLDACPTAWTETTTGSGDATVATYSCSTTPTVLLQARALTQATVNGLASQRVNGVDHLRFTLTLSSSAGNDLMGLTNAFTYTFSAAQLPGTGR